MKEEIGNDEFCLHCMEWRKYDKDGRCKVCKHIIFKKNKKQIKAGYNDYKIESSEFESEGDFEDNDFS